MTCSDSTTPIKGMIGRWFANNSVPLSVFAISRLGLFLVAYLSLILLPDTADIARARPENLFVDGWLRWDASWYAEIADNGYTNEPRSWQQQRDTAFFPMYPLLIRAARLVIGDTYLSGLLISNVAFLVALMVLYRLVSDKFDSVVANRSIVLLAVNPFSFFFSAMYSESVFLLAVVCAFYFGERRRWVLAALCAAVAGATRMVGVLVVFGLTVLYLEFRSFDLSRVQPNILWLFLGLLGPASFMLFLAVKFGDPLQFVVSQDVPGWGASTNLWSAIMALQTLLPPGSIVAGTYSAMPIIHLLVCVVAVLLSVYAWRRQSTAYGHWAVLTTILSLTLWRSMGRYAITVFPLFTAAAALLEDERWYSAVVYLSTLLLALLTVVFTHWYWVA